MKTLYICGHSDDGIEIQRADGTFENEVDAYGCGRSITLLSPEGVGLKVYAEYAPRAVGAAVWMIGVAPLDEGKDLPNWGMRYLTAANGYSPKLVIYAPDDVAVEYDGDDEDG